MGSMSRWLIVALTVAALVAGCKRHDEAAGLAADQASGAPPSPRGPGPMPTSTEPVVVTNTGDVNSTLQQLSEELRKYVIRTRSVPRDFEEFAAKSKAQFPPPPAGKKYAIQGQAVVLARK